MTHASRRFVLQGALFGVACACAAGGAVSAQTPPPTPGQKYMCPPCGCENDGKEFDAPGVCPSAGCGMTLIATPSAGPKSSGPPAPKLTDADHRAEPAQGGGKAASILRT